MRSVSRNLFRILNNEKLQPVQFVELRLLGTDTSSTMYFTDAGEQLAWDGNTYQPLNFGRGEIEEVLATESGENPTTTLTFLNVNAQMADLLNGAELEGAICRLRLADRRYLDRPRDAVTLAWGEVTEPQLTEETLVLTVNNVIGQLDRVVVPRRLWQAECNYTFGSRSCGVLLSESPFSITGACQSGSTRKHIVIPASVLTEAGDPEDPTEFWAAGYVVMKNGQAATQGRPFQSYYYDDEFERHVVTLRVPLLKTPAAGDEFIIRRGCRKTLGDCKVRQGSYVPYGGFPYVPYGRITPLIVSDY